MKQLLYFFVAFSLCMGVQSCSKNKDNTCVKQIAQIIETAYIGSGTDTDNDNMVMSMLTTSGDIFMTPEIWKIISDNKDYSLTDEDKMLLVQAITIIGTPKVRSNEDFSPALAEIYAAENRMIKKNANGCISRVKKADKLKDLLQD